MLTFKKNRNGRWRLSPAYDMGYAFNPKESWTSTHQMSVNGKFDNIGRADLLELASRNNIRNASQIIDEVSNVCAGWDSIARECDVPSDMIEIIVPDMQLGL